MADPERIPFVPLRNNVELHVYYSRGLPHWRQEGATYFVTFRTADSLPSSFREKWKEERDQWLRNEGIDPTEKFWKERFRELPEESIEQYEQLFTDRVDVLLGQGAGACLLSKKEFASIVAESLRFFAGRRIRLGDFVVMPNHVHLLLTPLSGHALESVIGAIKGFSGQKINEIIGATGPFWQGGFYDHLVRTGDSLLRFQEYIRNNPGKAG